jgi:MoaA/NifB/PqqE/SkfB family radical SAM enzyme
VLRCRDKVDRLKVVRPGISSHVLSQIEPIDTLDYNGSVWDFFLNHIGLIEDADHLIGENMAHKEVSEITNKDIPALRPCPSKLFVETTTRCNLNCIMCVKQTWDRKTMEGDMADETFAALEPAFPHLRALVLNGVGEPLLDPRLEEFIRRAKKSMPAGSWVGFQSNGMLLDEKRAVSLAEAGLDRICLSADALDPETFRKIRRGGEEQGVERAFAALQSAKTACGRPDLQIGLEFVLMRDNTRELPDLLRRAVSLGVTFAIVTHILPYAESSVPQTAFDSNMDGAVELFAEWREKAESEGLNLGDYFKVLWKYMRIPTGRELAEFFTELSTSVSSSDSLEAVQRRLGSSLPSRQITIKSFADTSQQVRKLFGEDGAWMDALERILKVLEEAAAQGLSGIDSAESMIHSWKENMERGEADLVECLKTIWKYSRTPKEQRLCDLVEEMKTQARSRGISLHLKNLMERDEEWALEIEKVFAEAEAVAAETGLELRLPAKAPSSGRRCDFIEEGSVFVSWNGNVHPCYFLWHQYGCHLFGRKKFVNAKNFGNVRQLGILDIWNDPSFRSFREEVLRYDFPYCSNCNVVPCQYLIAEEFEQDCYGNTVPCGDCFWCMGLFNCLR